MGFLQAKLDVKIPGLVKIKQNALQLFQSCETTKSISIGSKRIRFYYTHGC